jgi:tetratricopeptide (TPR) repeat protein
VLPLTLTLVALSQSPTPPPPSTGKEAPKAPQAKLPTKDEARAAWSQLLAAAKPGTRDCAKLIGPRARLAFMLAEPTPDEVKGDLESYLWMARCAEKQKYFVFMGDLGALMVKADPVNGHAELLARALLGLNATKQAIEIIDKLASKLPKDPDIALTQAKARCRARDWSPCLERADATLELASALPDAEKAAVSARAQKYRGRALLHLGKLDDAEAAAGLAEQSNAEKEDVEALRNALIPAQTYKLIVEEDHAPYVALGTYHLAGKLAALGPLVTMRLTNIGKQKQVRVEAGIQGVTASSTKTVTLQEGKDATVELTPPLLPTFDPASVRASRTVALDVKVTSIGTKGGEKVVLQESPEVELEPRDFLPLSASIDAENKERQYVYLGAWVTPNVKAVDAFLATAKQGAPRNTFAGEQSATVPQVKAIYDALKAKGVSYVMDPEVLSGAGFGQRTRLPAEVLASTNAQCLEGALLYASLFEAIGLKTAIIVVPGHAFVAWRASPKDGEPPDTVYFLETTMTHDAPFEAAMKTAAAEFDEARAKKKAAVVFVSKLREAGVSPQPFE